MATRTIGSPANNTFTAVPWPNMTAATLAVAIQDIAAINALILDDRPLLWPVGNAGTALGQNATQSAAAHPNIRMSLAREGLLHVPNRGVLKIFPGDWIFVDTFGFPYLAPGNSIQTNGNSWTISGNPT